MTLSWIAAGARVHGGRQHKTRWERQGHGGAGNADRTVFKRLGKYFQDVAGEFGQLVEKKQAVVGERNFSGTRDHAAADQPGVGDGVMRGTVGARSDQAAPLTDHS